MQLTRIDLDGFRQLVNRTFDFKPGLNLIYGPNEAGKSSLLDAIAILLYGFYDTGRITARDRELLNQHKPWSYLGEFGGVLEYVLDEGNAFQLRRIYAPETTTSVIRLADRRTITQEFPRDSDGRVYVVEQHLGISKSVFDNVCVVRQSELTLLEQSATSIAETIVRLSSTMALDGVTAKDAIDHLESTHKQKVGTARAYSRPFAMTQKRIKELEKEIVEARAFRDRSWDALTSINVLERDVEHLRRQQMHFQILLVKSRLKVDIQTRERITELQRDLNMAVQKAEVYGKWSDFRYELYERLVNLDARRIALEAELKAEPQTLSDTIQSLTRENDTLSTQLESINPISLELIEQIERKKDEVKFAKQTVIISQAQIDRLQKECGDLQLALEAMVDDAPWVTHGHGGVAKMRQQYDVARLAFVEAQEESRNAKAAWKQVNMTEEAFHALKNASSATPEKKGCRSILRKSAPQDAVRSELVIYSDLLPTFTRHKVAEATLISASHAKTRLESAVRRELSFDDVEIHDGFFGRASMTIDEYLKAEAARDMAMRSLGLANEALKTAETRLATLETDLAGMIPRGFQINQDLRDGHKRIEDLRRRLSDIEGKLASLHNDEGRWRKKRDEYRQCENELVALFEKAGIDNDDPLELRLNRYKVERENYFAWQAAATEVRSAEQRLQGYPVDASKVARQIEEAEAHLHALMDGEDSVTALDPVESSEWYQSALSGAQHALEDARHQLVTAQNETQRSTESDVDLASLTEEYAEAVASLAQLDWFGGSLQVAQKVLTEASTSFQQQFAPRLQAFLDSGLSHATNARYTQSRIDPETLNVHLLAPEIGSWINMGQLSTGTRDLVYLLLRFSIARLMSRSSEKFPMLLDDPFVHCDRVRKANILTYLMSQTSDMQFILFTQDDWTLSWMLKNHPECNVVAMSREDNSIDYDMVEDLIDESDAVRDRLQAAGDSPVAETGAGALLVPELRTAPGLQTRDAVGFTQTMLDDLSSVLAADQTASYMLRALCEAEWQAPESALTEIAHGQFLSIVIDRLNERSVDILGDQLIYLENGLLTVTEEYRIALAHMFA